jgi:hypothetical protein
MCGGEPLLVLHYFLGSFLHVIIIYSFSFYHPMCMVLRKLVCEVGEEDCTYVKTIYNGFWLEVVSHLFFCVFL